jgi:hypothetical protein
MSHEAFPTGALDGIPRYQLPRTQRELMTATTFIPCIAGGAALIALWVNVRFPKLMPWSMRRLVVHLVLAIAVVYAVGPAMDFVVRTGIPAAGLTSIFAVAFPVLVYEFLVGAWMIRLAQTSGAGFRA